MRGLLVVSVLFFALAARATAGGPAMLVGAAEDSPESSSYATSKLQMDLLKLAGLNTVRMTATWSAGETSPPAAQATALTNAVNAAQFSGVRVILSIYPFGSSVTPLTDQARSDFAAFAVSIARQFPLVHDFIIGNEPNLNRFWLPQFAPDGSDAAASSYEQLLATTYDALKTVRPHSTIYGGALAPHGVDKPNTGRDTHSATAFINDLGAAYRASGRALPIMNAFAFHPYPENSTIGPNFPHPNSTAIGLADYDKLVGLLASAFAGTAQRGATLPILYDEFGIESQIPAAKASLYTGTEPATTKPVDEATQAAYYRQAMQMSFCQKTVLGLLLFHVVDEKALSAWQSGLYYADGTPKSSLGGTRDAAGEVHRGVIATCPGLALTPKVTIAPATTTTAGLPVTLTCSLDCTFTLRLDGRATLRGSVSGGVAKKLLFRGHIAPGLHHLTATATAAANTGPPGTKTVAFSVRS
ncbi:MAG TPA: hypothetical protein VGH52_07165 [Gaiellaceae bacterium]